MNLPNYFLADLPAGAELTPTMITEACRALRRNREQYLASRSTQSLINILNRIAEDWLDPKYSFRKMSLEAGPGTTGFSRQTVEKGIDCFFGQFSIENL